MSEMNMNKWLFLGVIASLASCGGGGGGGGGDSIAGIGGTGITVTGSIDGFGSIFVNGIEFETGSASVVLDSESSTEDSLRLGMVVTVRGTVDDNGVVGTADSVEFDDDVQGPIASITTDADGQTKILQVLGVTVVVDKVSTVFDDVSFDTLAVDDVIEVSGFYDASNQLIATRIEKKENFVAGVSEIEVKGVVSNLSGTQFTLDTFTVDFSGADLSEVSGGALSNGLAVEVKGTLSGSAITATRVEEEDGPFDDNEDNVSIEGIITDFVSTSNFRVAGQLVDASSAQLSPADLNLGNGVKVEAEGAIVNGTLVAQTVEARGGSIRLSARVQSLNVSGVSGDITLGFVPGNITFSVNSQTELRDETDSFAILTLSDLRVGDYLEVRAFGNGDDIVATELRLEELDEDELQGPVESFVPGSEITVLGLTYSTPGEIFEDANDSPISSAAFFSQLSVGNVVKISDDEPGNGVADEVEFEN